MVHAKIRAFAGGPEDSKIAIASLRVTASVTMAVAIQFLARPA